MKTKKMLSFFLCFAMMLGVMPCTAAEGVEQLYLYWDIDDYRTAVSHTAGGEDLLLVFTIAEDDVTTDGSDAIAGFADKDEVSSYALDAVNWACNPKFAFVGGTLKGDKNYVMPRDNTTRAQMATILHRFVKYYE